MYSLSSSLLFCLAPIRPFHLAIRPAIYLACLGLEATLRRPRQVGVRETERERERESGQERCERNPFYLVFVS